MAAGIKHFEIEQGATFRRPLLWKTKLPLPNGAPVNITGWTGRMKIKKPNGTLLISLTETPNANGDRLTLGGAAGTITIYISDETTAAMDFSSARYDLELVDTLGDVRRLLKGLITFSREVTN